MIKYTSIKFTVDSRIKLLTRKNFILILTWFWFSAETELIKQSWLISLDDVRVHSFWISGFLDCLNIRRVDNLHWLYNIFADLKFMLSFESRNGKCSTFAQAGSWHHFLKNFKIILSMFLSTRVSVRSCIENFHRSLLKTYTCTMDILLRYVSGSLTIILTYLTMSLMISVLMFSIFNPKLNCLPRKINDSFNSTDGILSLWTIICGKYWIDPVADFFIPKVGHWSTPIIRSAHEVHLVNILQRSWLSPSKGVIMAVSPANWNQWGGLRILSNTYPKQLTSSFSIDFIRVFTHRLNINGEWQSPCRTPRLTLIGLVITFFVVIEIK